jgi:hypothetical protein
MLLPRKRAGARVTIASRVPMSFKTRLHERATQSGYRLSDAIAELLEFALDLEEKLKPFRPALDRLMREEKLSLADAVSRLLWMDVELDPPRE